jgi:hypothetical protein
MLFFFELGFVILALLTLLLAERWGRLPALALWSAITLLSVVASFFVRARLARRQAVDETEARWRRTLAESWRHLNLLLLLGLAALTGWYLLWAQKL